MPKRESLGEAWADYRDTVIPRGASDIQYNESRRAFYAGAMTIFTLFHTGLDGGTEPTPADLAYVESLARELRGYVHGVAKGR